MGNSRFDEREYVCYSAAIADVPRERLFKNKEVKKEWNPLNVKIRESRDSDMNPRSLPIILATDGSGSMGFLADHIVKKGLGELMRGIFDSKVIKDPHILSMVYGDLEAHDRSPLQVSQFEADLLIAQQLVEFHIEGGGGGNHWESDNAVWYFAATHTSTDHYEKRNGKGYLFTIGDEEAPPILHAKNVTKLCGDTPQQDFTAQELITMASRMYNVHHIVIEEGNYAKAYLSKVKNSWIPLLGENVHFLSDHRNLPELIVSIIEKGEKLCNLNEPVVETTVEPEVSVLP